AAEQVDAFASFETGTERPVAGEGQGSLPEPREGLGEPEHVLSVVERADAEEPGRPGRRLGDREHLPVDAARDDLDLFLRLGQLRLELARQVAELPARPRVEDGRLDLVATRGELPFDLRDERAQVGRVGPRIHLRDEQDPHPRSVCSEGVRAARLSIFLGLILAAGALVVRGPSRAPAASRPGVTIAGAGDIALQGPPPGSIFSRVRGPLRQADLAIGNLEGTLGSGGSSKCSAGSRSCFAFQSPPQSARLLRAAGFDDLNVANNHAFDYG